MARKETTNTWLLQICQKFWIFFINLSSGIIIKIYNEETPSWKYNNKEFKTFKKRKSIYKNKPAQMYIYTLSISVLSK